MTMPSLTALSFLLSWPTRSFLSCLRAASCVAGESARLNCSSGPGTKGRAMRTTPGMTGVKQECPAPKRGRRLVIEGESKPNLTLATVATRQVTWILWAEYCRIETLTICLTMASDEIVWQIVNNQHCSFKLTFVIPDVARCADAPRTPQKQSFCRNEYNVTGFCSRQNCPLANSRYATIRSDPATGRLYIYIKSVERAHLPNKWWERIRLPSNYSKALESIDERLQYWPKFLVHKCKQRLTRLTQVAIRTERLAREEERLGEKLVPKLASKVRRREQTRERKAEAAAKVERTIERELMERLRSGAYGEKPINVEETIWNRVLDALEQKGELEMELEAEDLEADADELAGDVEYVSDIDSQSEAEDADLEDWMASDGDGSDADTASQPGGDDTDQLQKAIQSLKRKRPLSETPRDKRLKGPKQQVVYETEEERNALQTLSQA
jgi:protein MAK16